MCGRLPETQVMDENIQRFLEGIKVGAKQSHDNMTPACLLKAEESDVGFMTLDEALDAGALAITELYESGSVPELRGRRPIKRLPRK